MSLYTVQFSKPVPGLGLYQLPGKLWPGIQYTSLLVLKQYAKIPAFHGSTKYYSVGQGGDLGIKFWFLNKDCPVLLKLAYMA